MDSKSAFKGLGLDNQFILWYLSGNGAVKPVSSLERQHSDMSSQKTKPNDERNPEHVKYPLSNHISIFQSSYACQSFPSETQLCWSSIPGKKFGVMASRLIPKGFWIGPYEGKLVDIEDVDEWGDRTNMWEILHRNQIRYFIDGTDLNSTSWMQFIQCARNKSEQNTSAIQYKGRVYYRALRDIDIGEEILVWYDDDCYEQYMGIPVIEQACHNVKSKGLTNSSEQYIRHKTSTEAKTVCEGYDTSNDTSSDGREKTWMMSQTVVLGVNTFGCSLGNSPSCKTFGNQSSTLNFHSNTSFHNCITSKDNSVERSVKCEQCCSTFSQRTLLQMHLCPKQTNTPYHCGQCPSSFSSLSDLRRHVGHHMGKKPFKCGFCERSFVGATTLNNHIRLHTRRK